MNIKDIQYMGRKVPLIVKNDVTSYAKYEHKETNLIKDEKIIFVMFISAVDNKQYFQARRENGDICLLSEDMVDIIHIPINVDETNNFKIPKHINEIKIGMKVLTLESDLSEIGAGLIVTIIKIDQEYSDGSFEITVENQWGGIDEIAGNEVAFVEEAIMTRKKALELAIEAIEYYKGADLSMVEEEKSHEDVSNELDSAVEIIRNLIEII
jgi:hypothetical protein